MRGVTVVSRDLEAGTAAGSMSWESDASSCAPPTIDDPTAEPLSNQLEALRLKVSPAMKEEVSNVLEALTGEAGSSSGNKRTLGYRRGKETWARRQTELPQNLCVRVHPAQTSSRNASTASCLTASIQKRRPRCGLALRRCTRQRCVAPGAPGGMCMLVGRHAHLLALTPAHVQVEAYCKRKGKPPSMNRKRQIFADILVW